MFGVDLFGLTGLRDLNVVDRCEVQMFKLVKAVLHKNLLCGNEFGPLVLGFLKLDE